MYSYPGTSAVEEAGWDGVGALPLEKRCYLVADNYTFPRDARLLKNTTAHVRIILCGVHDYINPKYLGLARKHGFSLHTIEGDIMDLSKLLEGETITIQGQQYQVTKDGFKLVRKT